jgi:hypothetical protein
MIARYYFIVACFFLSSCARYYLGDRLQISETPLPIGKDISYELIGWDGEENREKSALILRGLHESKAFRKISLHVKSKSDMRLQIILEATPKIQPLFGEHPEPVSWMVERKPIEFTAFILNRVFSYRTVLLFPIFQRSNQTVVFRIWKEDRFQEDFSYDLQTVSAFGWIPLAFLAFDDQTIIDQSYLKVSGKFVSDLKGKL